MDEVITPDLSSLVCEQVRDFIIKSAVPFPVREVNIRSDNNSPTESEAKTTISSTEASNDSENKQERMVNDLAKLELAFSRQVLYIIGKEQMKIRPGTKIWRKTVLRVFLWMRENTRTKVANLGIPTDRIVEVGFVKDV